MGGYLSSRIQKITGSPIRALQARVAEMHASGTDVINLGIGEPRWKTPVAALRLMQEYASNKGRILTYPANQGIPKLLEAVSAELRQYGLSYGSKEIIVANGGREILDLGMACLVNPGDVVISVAPYWVTYPELAKKYGGIPVCFPTSFAEEFVPNAARLEQLVSGLKKEKPDRKIILVMANPSNPLGIAHSRETLAKIADVAKKYDVFVISDEIYAGLVPGCKSIASIDGMRERTLVATGMAKAYSMTSFAVGFGAAPEWLIKEMNKLKGHDSVTPLVTQEASLAVLTAPQEEKEPYKEEMREEFIARKKIMLGWLKGKKMDFAEPADGMFYVYPDVGRYIGMRYVNTKGKQVEITNSGDFCLFMLEVGHVNMVPGSAFSDPSVDLECGNHVRISLAVPQEQLKKAIERMDGALAQLKK